MIVAFDFKEINSDLQWFIGRRIKKNLHPPRTFNLFFQFYLYYQLFSFFHSLIIDVSLYFLSLVISQIFHFLIPLTYTYLLHLFSISLYTLLSLPSYTLHRSKMVEREKNKLRNNQILGTRKITLLFSPFFDSYLQCHQARASSRTGFWSKGTSIFNKSVGSRDCRGEGWGCWW